MQNDDRDSVVEIDLQDIFGLLVAKAWIILISVLVAGVGAFIISRFVIAPVYESTTSVYILSKNTGNTMTYSDTQLATQLTKDYEKLITGRYVLEQVIDEFDMDVVYETLLKKVSVENETDTRIIEITVKDENPYLAQQLADAIREAASEHIKDVTDVEAVNIVNVANFPSAPSEPSVLKWTVIGIMAGFMASAGILVLRYLLDDTLKSSDDIEKYLGLSTLALIPVSENVNDTRHTKAMRKTDSAGIGIDLTAFDDITEL